MVHYLLLLVLSVGVCSADFPFRNTSLPWGARVDDLVSRLTLEEIMLQMTRGGISPDNGPTPPITRLGIGPYSWNTECLRGDADAGNATSFPQSLGLSASWEPNIIRMVAEATGVEVRGKYNYYVKKKQYGTHKGISCFSPVINILRDPRWGRNEETYGEDPYLSGQYAAAFVQGLQGNDSRYLRANAGCKHFDVYAGPESIPVNRFGFNAVVNERDWRTTFLPAFRTCVKAGTVNIMCSYNSINGVPACANKHLLTDILRTEWGFQGYVISDQQAVEHIIDSHHYLNNSVDTVAACVNAGVNLELSDNIKQPVFLSMLDAIKQGKLTEGLVRERVKKLFYTRMRLGEFDPPEMNPYSKFSMADVETSAHRELAILAATKSFVLLKNDKQFLPILKNLNNIAVVGPMTFEGKAVFGNYAPQTEPEYISLTIDGLKTLATNYKAAAGCNDSQCNDYDAASVKNAVSGAEVVFIALGTGATIEREGHDRADIELPKGQQQLLMDAVKYSNGAPVVLLMFNAGPLNISWAVENPQIMSILEAYYPAQSSGEALRRALTAQGGEYAPAGRLPNTWPVSLNGFPEMVNYSMEGRTYRYFKTDVLFPFGYGLAYSKFDYNFLETPISIDAGDDLTITVMLTNTGPYNSDEVVQVYISWQAASQPTPQLQLGAFKRVNVDALAYQSINMTVPAQNLAVWSPDDGWLVEQGTVVVSVGGQQPNQKVKVDSNVISVPVKIVGTRILGKY